MTEKKKTSARSQVSELKSSDSVQETASTPARDERRTPAKQEKKSVARRETKKSQASLLTPLRNNQFGRFLIDAYYELRHKVTWPTFLQARNMTVAVVAISVVVGGFLALLDLGLLRLFLLIAGGK